MPLVLLALLGCPSASPICRDGVEAWADEDGDGFGGASLGTVCELGPGQVDNPLDCDDADPAVNPDAADPCDGIDQDCDGRIDGDDPPMQVWADADGDGYGVRYPSKLICGDTPEPGWATNADDCDDFNGAIHPAAMEWCGGGDEDCDGYLDDYDDNVEPMSYLTFYLDQDGDGVGDRNQSVQACRAPNGYVADKRDCNDDNPQITYREAFDDADGDGFGDPGVPTLACALGSGKVDNDLDCDDADPLVTVDVDWYDDPDGDGFGSGPSQGFQCFPPQPGMAPNALDCDESDPLHNPDTPEDCADGLDQNCNLLIDCDDPVCGGDPACVPPCAEAVLSDPTPIVATGNTTGRGNDINPTCGASNAQDVVFAYTPSVTRQYNVNTFGSGYDTVVAVFAGCGGAQLACNDDAAGLQSQVFVNLTAGVQYLIVVDGYSTSTGPFTLTVQ